MARSKHPLEFERELYQLEEDLVLLQNEISGGDSSRKDEFSKLENQITKMRKDVYGKLSHYQRVQLSRHFDRPNTLDYIEELFTDFVELHGDRKFRDDPAIVGGTAKFGESKVMIVGHQRGTSMEERLKRNFGMPQPEGYRKALRLFELAEKFALPVISFIDTQGAFPGIEAEERGQAQAIAQNLAVLSELSVPVINVVIGEGGSGGALALGVGDVLLMLENSIYSVITPEGCASILWPPKKGQENEQLQKAAYAAEMLKLTASDLKGLGVVEEVIAEPEGGAHRDLSETAANLSEALGRWLENLGKLTVEELLNARYDRLRKIGPVVEG